MAKPSNARVLKALLGQKVFFNGKFSRGQEDFLRNLAEAQQAVIADDLDASVTHLVLAEISGGKTIQKKASSLIAKGASIQVMDAADFEKLVKPTTDQIIAMLRSKPEHDLLGKVFSPTHAYRFFMNRKISADHTIVGEDFSNADFEGLNLSSIEFIDCQFNRAGFKNTQLGMLKRCSLDDCQADHLQVNLVEDCACRRAKLGSASHLLRFTQVDLSDAEADGFAIGVRHFNNAQTLKCSCLARNARLPNAQCIGFTFTSADFSNADLTGAIFNNCELAGAIFTGAKLAGASLVGCKLAGADLRNTDLSHANFADADLSNARLDGATVTNANFRNATITNVDLSPLAGYFPAMLHGGVVGPAMTELDAVAAKRIQIEIRLCKKNQTAEDGTKLTVDTAGFRWGYGLNLPMSHYGRRPSTMSDSLLEAVRQMGNHAVQFHTLEVSASKCALRQSELRPLVMKAIAEAFNQPLPPEDKLAEAVKAWRENQKEQGAADRERREAAKKLAEKQKQTEKKQIARKIAREVGKVTDIATFLKALELRADKSKIDKATKMLKAERFKLFNDVTDAHLAGVIKSQTDPDLVYACRIESDGNYACCTQNLNICGGLRGSICKHLLVLIIGLVKAGELDPTTIDGWVAKTHDTKPELNKETMGEIFIRYKGAEAGEVDWRPTETLPEDYYAL